MRTLLLLLVVAVLLACNQPRSEVKSDIATTPAPVEMGDSTKVNHCKDSYAALTGGDVDAFVSSLADDAIFYWNSGDSISGKAAIGEYWKDRRANVIDKLEIKDEVWLPLKVNNLANAASGDYVLMWAMVTTTYKFGGNPMTQRFHQVFHFDDAGKIDYLVHYIDRYDIAAALPPPKTKKQ